MAARTPIESNISFADATMISFGFEDNNQTLNVLFSAWNEKIIKIQCEPVLYFLYIPGDCIAGVYQVLNDSSILHAAVLREFSVIPEHHLYKLILVEDINDFPVMQIVCKNSKLSII